MNFQKWTRGSIHGINPRDAAPLYARLFLCFLSFLCGLFRCLLGNLIQVLLVFGVEVQALLGAVFLQLSNAVFLSDPAQLFLLLTLQLIGRNVGNSLSFAFCLAAVLQFLGNLGHYVLQIKEECEHDKCHDADHQQAALVGTVDPGGSCCGLICVQSDAFHGLTDLLGSGILGEHQTQVEDALAQTGRNTSGKANQTAGSTFSTDTGLIFHMVDGVAHEGHEGIDKGQVADCLQGAACVDHGSVAGIQECGTGTDDGSDSTNPDALSAAELLDQGQHDQQAGAHGGHGDHLELCLDLSILAVGIAVDDPAGVVDQSHVTDIVQHLVDQNGDDQDDPVLALQTGLELIHQGSFLNLGCGLVGDTVLVTAFLGNTLTGKEVLNEGQRNGDAAHQAHAHQIALAVVVAHHGAHTGHDHGEHDGDEANANILDDLAGHGIVLSLLHITGGQRSGQLVGHVPHGVAHGIEQVEGEEENTEVPTEIEKVYALFEGETEVFREGSPEYEALFKGLTKSIIENSKKGLDAILVSSATIDNIKLEVWGEFLNKYIDSTTTKFKPGDITFKFDNFSFILVNNTSSRKFVVEEVIPTLIEGVKEASLSYPMYEYALDITSGAKLKDFECNLKKVRQVGTVFPLQNLEGYSVYYTGAHYGFAMSSEYTDILRGYIEGDESGYYRRVDGPKPGCVNVLSYITILNNIKDFTLEDKTLVDFRIYKNLAVRLDTKELIDTTDMTTDNKVLDYILESDNFDLVYLLADKGIVDKERSNAFKTKITEYIESGKKITDSIPNVFTDNEVLDLLKKDPNLYGYLMPFRLNGTSNDKEENVQFKAEVERIIYEAIENGSLELSVTMFARLRRIPNAIDTLLKQDKSNLLYIESFDIENISEYRTQIMALLDEGKLKIGRDFHYSALYTMHEGYPDTYDIEPRLTEYILKQNPAAIKGILTEFGRSDSKVVSDIVSIFDKTVDLKTFPIDKNEDLKWLIEKPELLSRFIKFDKSILNHPRLVNASVYYTTENAKLIIDALGEDYRLDETTPAFIRNNKTLSRMLSERDVKLPPLTDMGSSITPPGNIPPPPVSNEDRKKGLFDTYTGYINFDSRVLPRIVEDVRLADKIDPTRRMPGPIIERMVKAALESDYILNENSFLPFRMNPDIIIKSIKEDPRTIEFAVE